MYFKIFLLFLLFIFSHTVCNAQVDVERLKEAQKTLEETEKKFSKEHIEYAYAALDLAALYYVDEQTMSEGDSLAIPALKFIRNAYSPESNEYQDALFRIPYQFYSILDAELDAKEAADKYGKESVVYAQKLLKLSVAFLNNNQYQGHEICLKAFQLLNKFPPEQVKDIYEYAYQNVDAIVLSLVTHQLDLEKIAIAAPQTIPHADALVNFAQLSIEHFYYDKAFTYLDSSYLYIKYALDIYKKNLNEKDKKYKTAFQTFTPEMQRIYPLEKSILERLYRHETATDSFVADLRFFLRKVDSADFLTYSVKNIFDQVSQDIIEYNGDQGNKYYEIIQAIRSTWHLNENQNALENQIAQTEQIRVAKGQFNEEYALSMIKQANFQSEEANKEQAILWYIQAFDILDEIDMGNSNETNFQKYIKFVKYPWNTFITNEHNLKISKELRYINEEQYLQAMFQTAWDYTKNNQLKARAEAYYRDALKTTKESNFYISIAWLDSLLEYDALAGIDIISPILPDKATPLQVRDILKKPLKFLQTQYGDFSIEYAKGLELLADSYYTAEKRKDLLAESLTLYQKVLSIYKFKEGVYVNYPRLLKKIARQIEKKTHWSINESIAFFDMLIYALERQKVDKKMLAAYLFRYANWHYEQNRVVESESIFRRYIDLFPETETSPSYIQALYNLGRINRKTGRYQTAKNYYQIALDISQKTSNNIFIIKCLDDLGLIEQQNKNYDQALHFFQLSLKTLEEFEQSSSGKSRYKNRDIADLYAKILRHIGRLYFDKNDLNNAQKYYTQVKDFEQNSNKLVNFQEDISLHRDLALLYEKLEDSTKTLLYYKLAIKSLKDKDEMADVNISFGDYFLKRGQDSVAGIYYKNALKIDLEQIENNYINLSEQERFLFLESMSKRFNVFWNFAIQSSNKQILKTALDAHLILKGLSLETTTNLQGLCYSTENVMVQTKCARIQTLRKKLAKSTFLSPEEQALINEEIVDLEKAIGVSSKDLLEGFEKENKKLNFNTLQNILKNDSLAIGIDFLVIQQMDELEEMQNVYYAVLVNTLDSFPHLIRLATEAELQDVLAPDIAPNTVNYITDGSESYYLYQLVWEPLLPFIKNSKKIHLCPTGILSKISFNTLRINNYTNQRIMDLWSIHYYSSLRDLLQKRKNQNFQEGENIALVGGVKFTFTTEQVKQLASQLGVQQDDISTIASEFYEEDLSSAQNRGEDFNYLPGTLSEIKNIAKIFPTDIVIKSLQDTLATEENFYTLTEDLPSILHIATHGYFFQNPKDNLYQNKSSKSSSFETKIAKLNNPLLRSGLALAGINRVWKGGENIEGMEDGILTALEVSNMDLFNTKLVVLSACETGRGDIDNNEGIMGLRRAFKTAGAQQLIISLWKVPDEQTSELMQIFYTNYINGMPIHKAFEAAQHSMRIRYNNPYYWAAFLLIE